jgi:EpsI family protein
MKASALLRFSLAAALIALTAILLQARGRIEVIPPHLPLSAFPAQLANWDSNEIVQDKKTLEVLGPGDFLERVYQDPAQKQPYVDVFLAYFPSQRAGETPHSPQHCLPGSGWSPEENVRISLALPGHAPFPANRYVIAKADQRRLVLYWFWAHDRGVASEYWAKFYLVLGQILSGGRRHPHEPQRRFSGAPRHSHVPRRNARRRPATRSSLYFRRRLAAG